MKLFEGIQVEKVGLIENYFLGSVCLALLVVLGAYTHLGWKEGLLGAIQCLAVALIAGLIWFAVMIRPDHDPIRRFVRRVGVSIVHFFHPNSWVWWVIAIALGVSVPWWLPALQ